MKLTDFFHKPHKAQKLGPAWTDVVFVKNGIPRKRFTAPRAGVLLAKLYLPIGYTGSGLVRVRLVREPFKGKPLDPTGYDERTLHADGDGFARLSFGVPPLTPAEKGRKYRWQAQVLGHANASTTGTQYAEWLVL